MILDVPSSFKRPDGKWQHHIRQSDISRFHMCPDLHRRYLRGEVKDQEGDAAIVGSACHHAYAEAAMWLQDGLGGWGAADVLAEGHNALETLWEGARADETLRQLQIPSIDNAHDQIDHCISHWLTDFLPLLASARIDSVEYQFDVKVYEDNARVIYIAGTWDLGLTIETPEGLRQSSIWDYKHSNSQTYSRAKAWQLSRYSPQPTIYVWAYAQQLDNLVSEAVNDISRSILDWNDSALLVDFFFVNIRRDKYQLDIIGPNEGLKTRTVGDCRFMLQEMLSMCYLIESDLPTWPLGATDWWCSNKWCNAWSNCRGKHIGPDPWQLQEKAIELMEKKR